MKSSGLRWLGSCWFSQVNNHVEREESTILSCSRQLYHLGLLQGKHFPHRITSPATSGPDICSGRIFVVSKTSDRQPFHPSRCRTCLHLPTKPARDRHITTTTSSIVSATATAAPASPTSSGTCKCKCNSVNGEDEDDWESVFFTLAANVGFWVLVNCSACRTRQHVRLFALIVALCAFPPKFLTCQT